MARKDSQPGGKENAAMRRQQSLSMRRAGMRYEQIAEQLGISQSTAYEDVQHELERTSEMHRADREHMARMQLERLDELLMAHWPKARRGDAQATQTILKIMERHARLTGIDQPIKQEHSGSVQIDNNAYELLTSRIDSIAARIRETAGPPGANGRSNGHGDSEA